MIRLVHTADVHLDRCYSGVRFPAAFGNRRRQSLRDVFLRIVARAGEWPADALLVAGDLFEHDRVSRDTIAVLRRAFDTVPHVPIFISPGNHDPFLPGSPYASQRWPENVFIFSRPEWEPVTLDRVPLTVHGFGFDGPDISVNPFGRLRIECDDSVHVAVAHGSEMGSLPAGKGAYAPFRVDDATPHGLRYLALGHFHGAKRIACRNGTCVQYSGSPEGHGFGETGLHVHVEVEIDGEETRVREVPSSSTVFSTHDLDCDGFESTQQIVEAIRGLLPEPKAARVARVTLHGAVPPTLRPEIPAIRDSVRECFEYLELIDELETENDYDALALEQTSLGAFAQEINTQIRDTTDPNRLEVLRRAREVGIAAYRGQAVPLRGAGGE